MDAFVELGGGFATALTPTNLMFSKLLTLSLPQGPLEALF